MQKNKNNFEFGEKRFVFETGGSKDLRKIIKSAGEDLHPEENNKEAFEKEQTEDTRTTAKQSPDDTYEKSKVALETLLTQKEKVKKLTTNQLDQLKAEIKKISEIDADAALESSEIKKIGEAVDKLDSDTEENKQSSSKPIISLSKLEKEQKINFKAGKDKRDLKNANTFLKNVLEKNIDEAGDKFEESFEEMKKILEKFGLTLDQEDFKSALAKEFVKKAKKENDTDPIFQEVEFDDLAKDSEQYDAGEFNPIDSVEMWWNGSSHLNDVIETITGDFEEIRNAFDSSKLEELDIDPKELIADLQNFQGVNFIEGNKLVPENILDYIMRGGDLIEDLKKVAIMKKWDELKTQLHTELKIDPQEEKKVLKILAHKDISELKELLDLVKLKDAVLPQIPGIKAAAFEYFDLIDEKGNLKLSEILDGNKLQEINEKVSILKKNYEAFGKKAEKIVLELNQELSGFGVSLPAFSEIVKNGSAKGLDLAAMFENPNELEKMLLASISKDLDLEINGLGDLVELVREKIESAKTEIDDFIRSTLEEGVPIGEGKTIKLKKDFELTDEKIIAIRKKIVPCLSEFISKKEDISLLKEGNIINIAALKKALKNEEVKKILSGEIKDDPKLRGELTEFLTKSDTPALQSLKNELVECVDPKDLLGLVAEDFKKALETKGGILDKIGAIFGIIGKYLSMAMKFFNKSWNSGMKTLAGPLEGIFATKFGDKALGWMPETFKEEVKNRVDANNLLTSSKIGFTKEELSEIKKDEIKMSELMVINPKSDEFEQLVTKKKLKITPKKLALIAEKIHKSGKYSAVNDDYKSIFDFVKNNPDSLAKPEITESKIIKVETKEA